MLLKLLNSINTQLSYIKEKNNNYIIILNKLALTIFIKDF